MITRAIIELLFKSADIEQFKSNNIVSKFHGTSYNICYYIATAMMVGGLYMTTSYVYSNGTCFCSCGMI
jgi:hypothetical protein